MNIKVIFAVVNTTWALSSENQAYWSIFFFILWTLMFDLGVILWVFHIVPLQSVPLNSAEKAPYKLN